MSASNLTWAEEQRQNWIAECLYIFGFINREHIQKKFRVSPPQASTDLKMFAGLYPHAMTYNASLKRYEVKP